MSDEVFMHGPPTVVYIHFRVSRAAFEVSIVVSHAGGLVPHCQIFHLRASFRPAVPFAYHFCKYGWTPSGLPLLINCAPIHNAVKNLWGLPMPRSCISLFAENLPSGKTEESKACPRHAAFFAHPHTPAVLTSDRVRRGRRPLRLPERRLERLDRGPPLHRLRFLPFLSSPVFSSTRRSLSCTRHTD